jgi:hypothetical protein
MHRLDAVGKLGRRLFSRKGGNGPASLAQQKMNWKETACFHCQNEMYWRERAARAEEQAAKGTNLGS